MCLYITVNTIKIYGVTFSDIIKMLELLLFTKCSGFFIYINYNYNFL